MFSQPRFFLWGWNCVLSVVIKIYVFTFTFNENTLPGQKFKPCRMVLHEKWKPQPPCLGSSLTQLLVTAFSGCPLEACAAGGSLDSTLKCGSAVLSRLPLVPTLFLLTFVSYAFNFTWLFFFVRNTYTWLEIQKVQNKNISPRQLFPPVDTIKVTRFFPSIDHACLRR